MRHGVHLGTIAGIKIGANWSVLVVTALLVQMLALAVVPAGTPVRWLLAAAGAVTFLLSLLAHELAHAFVARAFGVRVERVTLWLLGGVAELGGEPPSPRADLLTAAAGPAASAVFGGLVGTFAVGLDAIGAPAGVVAVMRWLAAVNVLLAVFNLLPGAPLDGGRVLRAALWRWHGDRDRAALGAAGVGRVLGWCLVALGAAELVVAGLIGGIWLALIGWFLVSAAGVEAGIARDRMVLHDAPVSSAMQTRIACVDQDCTVAEAAAAVIEAAPEGRAVALRTPGGRPEGLVRVADFARVPPSQRADVPVRRIAMPSSAVAVVAPSQRLADVAGTVSRAGGALVVDNGVLVGLLDRADVARAFERSALGPKHPGPGADAGDS
jgi:Zn-dependent protease/CBS domain-containing protein